MTKIRAGLFSHDFYPIQGGQGRNFYELFRCLRSGTEDLEVLAFSPCFNNLQGHLQLHRFSNGIPMSQLAFSAALNLSFPRIIKKYRLDVVLLNGPLGGVLLLRSLPCPAVYCVNHTYSQQARHIRSQRWKKMMQPLEKAAIAKADALVAISASTRDELIGVYGLNPASIDLIPVGIDTACFNPGNEQRRPDSLLYVGRLETRKGIQFLLDAMPRLLKHRPQAVLYVAGEGSLSASLKEFAASRGLGDSVIFLGRVSDEQLLELYRRSEVQIIPSLFEGLGVVALEGMACGAVVAASNVAGLRDVITDGMNGRLVPYGDSDALADTVAELLSDAGLRQSCRQNAYETVARDFSWPAIAARYKELLIKTARGGAAA